MSLQILLNFFHGQFYSLRFRHRLFGWPSACGHDAQVFLQQAVPLPNLGSHFPVLPVPERIGAVEFCRVQAGYPTAFEYQACYF